MKSDLNINERGYTVTLGFDPSCYPLNHSASCCCCCESFQCSGETDYYLSGKYYLLMQYFDAFIAANEGVSSIVMCRYHWCGFYFVKWDISGRIFPVHFPIN